MKCLKGWNLAISKIFEMAAAKHLDMTLFFFSSSLKLQIIHTKWYLIKKIQPQIYFIGHTWTIWTMMRTYLACIRALFWHNFTSMWLKWFKFSLKSNFFTNNSEQCNVKLLRPCCTHVLPNLVSTTYIYIFKLARFFPMDTLQFCGNILQPEG